MRHLYKTPIKNRIITVHFHQLKRALGIVLLLVSTAFYYPTSANFFTNYFKTLNQHLTREFPAFLMTSPTLVGSSNAIQGSNVTAITINQPSSTSVGDFLIAFISTDGNTNLSSPAGWSMLNQGQSNDNASTLAIFYRTANSVGSTSHTFSWSGGQHALGTIVAYADVDTTNPFVDFSAANDITTGTSNNPTSSNKVVSVENAVILYAYSADADYGNNIPFEPNGTTPIFGDRSANNGSNGASIGVAFKTQTSTGATGTGVFDMRNNNSEQWRAVTLALAPLATCHPANIEVAARPVSCNGNAPNATANSDGAIVLNSVTAGDRYLITANNDFGNLTAADATTFNQSDLPFTLLANLSNPDDFATYTVRIFNGNDDNCATDVTVMLLEENCNPACSCTDYLYVNDEDLNEIHKFDLGGGSTTLSEIGAPWLAGINQPHGLASDINGRLYIKEIITGMGGFADGFQGPIHQLSTEGATLSNNYLNYTFSSSGNVEGGHNFNFASSDGILYTPDGRSDAIEAYSLCDGSYIGGVEYPENRPFVWGFTIHKGNWYAADRITGKIHTGSIDLTNFTTPNSTGSVSVYLDSGVIPTDVFDGKGLMGITFDENDNLYVVLNSLGADQPTAEIRKYDASGTLVQTITDNNSNGQTGYTTNGNTGFWGARGIVYSQMTQQLYVSSKVNCVTVFDKNLTELSVLNIGNPANGSPKGLNLNTECCPTTTPLTINETVCSSNPNEKFFLQELLACEGVIAEGQWTETANTSGGNITFNSCDLSINVTGLGCATYTLAKTTSQSGNQQCGAFDITVEICSVSPPTNDTPTTTQGTCNGTTPNNDASITIPNIMNADVVGISTAGASSYDGSTYEATAAASDLFLVAGNSVTILGLAHNQSYIVRLFNQSSNCFIDETVTSAQPPTACRLFCDCNEYIYLNDVETNSVHKFLIEADGITLTEIGNPWLSGVKDPHGLGTDLNGFLYIGETSSGPIIKSDCDGNILDNEAINDGGFNFVSVGNLIYINSFLDDKINIFDLCTGQSVGSICLNPTPLFDWGLTLSQDKSTLYANDNVGSQNEPGHIWKIDIAGTDYTQNQACVDPYISDPDFAPLDLIGMVVDEFDNLYVVTQPDGEDAVTIIKYDSNGMEVASLTDDVDDQSGFFSARGITYSPTTGNLYLATFIDDCIAVVDAETMTYLGPGVGYVPNAGSKTINILKECCPKPATQTIDQTYCEAVLGEKLFLNKLFPCDGIICGAGWTPDPGNTGMTYDPCDQSITINATEACGTFTKMGSSDQCGAFNLTYNIDVLVNPDVTVTGADTICADQTLDLTANSSVTGITYQWQISDTDCNGTWSNIGGATNATYTVSGITADTDYRVLTTASGTCSSGSCVDTSACVTVNVIDAITATITSETCHNNNTNGNVNDDYVIIEVSATNPNAGASNQYQVYFDGQLLATENYGTTATLEWSDTAQLQRFAADGTAYNLTFQDADDASCTQSILTTGVMDCSACPSTICLPIKVVIRRGSND